jgi:6-phosphogluconolactonase
MTLALNGTGADVHAFADAPATVKSLASRVIAALRQDLDTYGDATLVVSGGSTPIALFGELSQVALDWSRVKITLADERWVPSDHEDSNEGMVRRILMTGAAAAAQFVPLYTGHDTPEAGEQEAAANIGALRRPFSVVLLGMGTDGHFASCFPGAPNLSELLAPDTTELVRAVRPPSTKHPRITLTLACLRNTKLLALQIHGEKKKAVIESAVENALPVGQLLGQPFDIFWSP